MNNEIHREINIDDAAECQLNKIIIQMHITYLH